MVKIKQIFKKENNIIIGMVHFPPLLGYKDFPGMDVCLEKSLGDAETLKQGGVDAIMVENNYDIPHKVFITQETKEIITSLTKEIVKAVSMPIGINVLWNDYKAGLSVAKECGCKFVRVPVFVDSVKTECGEIIAEPKKVLSFREEINASEIALFTDIQVKHAHKLKEKTIAQSAKEAVENDSDGIIITGKWTGDIPSVTDLKEARETVGKIFPLLVGSGATKDNLSILLKYANAIIVGTSLKTGGVHPKEKEVNLKPWQERISLEKTKEFMAAIREL